MSAALGKFRRTLPLVFILVVACGGDEKKTAPPPTVGVDTALTPASASIPGIDGGPARPLARATGPTGPGADFVASEMVVGTDDPAQLEGVRARWNGTVLKTLDLAANGITGQPTFYLLQIDASSADPTRIPSDMLAADSNAHGDHRVSSDAALHLLAAISEERSRGDVTVAANWVTAGQNIDDGALADAPAGYGDSAASWTPNIAQQPGFRRGDAQDIGVADAWRVFSLSDRGSNRVKIVIADGGFSPNTDLPMSTDMHPIAWGQPNPSSCTAGFPCPWHGTGVAQIAFAPINNTFGTAGVAAQVADPTLVPMPAGDFFQIVSFVIEGVPQVIGPHRIVNISAAASIPAGWYLLTFGALDAVTAILRADNTLIVAAAGNDGQDVDDIDCLDILGNRIACWEGTVWVPCELPGVICVGGLQYDAALPDASSNFHGADNGSGSVDIHAPFWNWIGPDPADPSTGSNAALIAGTSGGSPFVAGVAALVWAANPSLDANGVEDTLYRTAHPGPTASIMRIVNAYAAVRDAMGGNMPPHAHLITPVEGSSYNRGQAAVPFFLTLEDEDLASVSITWQSSIDGVIGTGTSTSSLLLSAGAHTITATITDGPYTLTRVVHININDAAPVVSISQPAAAGIAAYATQVVHLAASTFDFGTGAPLPDASVAWSLDSATNPAFATGNVAAYTMPDVVSTGFRIYATGTSSAGLKTSASFQVTPYPAPENFPPDVVITTPQANTPTYIADTHDVAGYFKQVTLSGTATDVEDGTLTGASLTWWVRKHTASGVTTWAQIGSGATLNHNFYADDCPSSTYDIELRATDNGTASSEPQISTYDVTISVELVC